ncbi:hypothetical protein DICVIV_13169 [Dictyocaulus viviparus]|uniref:Uncharacterized protein n=1 Tax=Dictyocaulus viviparus TaxID=29172 RepID=A0A0D8X8K1_DICVI|nr:hypothetical protein DICVIV_13169 [Dictyocaulus viviparus]
MFSKLSENMDRICAIYGDGSLFSRSSLPFDAELDELSILCNAPFVQKLSETDARDQLERYALRCHISEREKEQLHKRNRELNDAVEILRTQVVRGQCDIVNNDAVEILRTQVVRGQCDIVNNARVLAKQATDALRALEQTSTAEITKLKQKHALSLAQSSTLQNQLKHTAANLEAKKEELKEINKNYDMLRFERDSLRNHTDYLEQELEQVKNRVHDLVEELKMKEDALKVNREKVNAQDSQICALKEKLKKVESDAKEHVRRRENEITQQMDHYLQETKSIDAERERLAKLKIIEMQQRLKQLEEQKEAAERRAQVAEEKVADYKNNFVHYRGQMEGEAIRAITNGYRNALSIIPSSRKETGLSFDKLFPLKPRSYSENVEPSEDSFKKPSGSHCSRPSSKSVRFIVQLRSFVMQNLNNCVQNTITDYWH